MPALWLLENATWVLGRAHINVPDSYEDKWLIYNTTSGCSQNDAWELLERAVRENGGLQPAENEFEELGLGWPAETDGRKLGTLQEVLDYHVNILSE